MALRLRSSDKSVCGLDIMPVTGNCNGVIGTAMLVWQDPVVMSADKCQLIHGSDAQLMKQYM